MPLPKPTNLNLPFFVYGCFKPWEPAFDRIKPFVVGNPVPATIRGSLLVRDGLPILKLAAGCTAEGYVLHFDPAKRQRAYTEVCEFVSRDLYTWEQASIPSPPQNVNVLVGKNPERGGAEMLGGNWSHKDDPLLKEGLQAIRGIVDAEGKDPFSGRFAQPDWERFFHLQMAYLLLWSAIERFATLAYGSSLNPNERVRAIGGDPKFRNTLNTRIANKTMSVSDSEKPSKTITLSASDPSSSAQFYWKIRCNSSHRGKSAFTDANLLRESLADLLAIFDQMLA